MAVQLKAEVAETDSPQTPFHDFEGCKLLGYEQDGFSAIKSCGDEIGDGLRLARSGVPE
jgi:hypothetical protein